MLECRFAFGPEAERSIEADPRLVTREQLAMARDLGFQRVSFGVQDFDPAVQVAIGRLQSEGVVREAVELARETSFHGVNIDLVYGLPEQTVTRFKHTLQAALMLQPDRVACYNYAHVPQVRHNQQLIDATELPSRDDKFHLFQMAVEAFTDSGYEWIGLDHFARGDDELACATRAGRLRRDFMGYTTRTTPHLRGFGMSAIGDVAGRFVQTVPRTGQYQRDLDGGKLPVARGHRLSEDDKARRLAILRLMCNLDLPFRMLPPPADQSAARLQPLVEDELITAGGEGYEVTSVGRWFLRNIAMALDAYLPQQAAATRPVSAGPCDGATPSPRGYAGSSGGWRPRCVGRRRAVPIDELAAGVPHQDPRHDQAEGAYGRRQSSSRADGSTQQPGAGEQEDAGGQQEEALGGLLVVFQRSFGHHLLDALLLPLSGLDRQPGAGGQRAGQRSGENPGPGGAWISPPVPQGAQSCERQKEGQDNREVDHGGVQRIGQHLTAPMRGTGARCDPRVVPAIRHSPRVITRDDILQRIRQTTE
jgi:oxygen-independent coproporphyrinogen-3 oxidase